MKKGHAENGADAGRLIVALAVLALLAWLDGGPRTAGVDAAARPAAVAGR